VIPFTDLGDVTALLGEGEGVTAAEAWDDPAPTAFFVQASGPHARQGVWLLHVLWVGVDFCLVTVHAASGDLDGLASGINDGGFLIVSVAPELHARIQAWVIKEVILEDEVRIILRRREEGVGRVQCRGTDEDAVLDGVSGFAAFFGETSEVLAVEDRLGGHGCQRQQGEGEEGLVHGWIGVKE